MLLKGNNAALLALSYLGRRAHDAELQHDGPGQGQPGSCHALPGLLPRPAGVRANAISAGPIKTLAASGIGSFGKLLATTAAPSRAAAAT